MSDVDYESMVRSLLTLLDRIELENADINEIHALCQQRFDIARDHGLTVVFKGEPASAAQH